MYSLRQAIRGLKNPNLIAREFNIACHRRFYFRDFNNGIDVIKEDWDNLIILDACRYDMFEELNTISGKLSPKTSRASSTNEFLEANFHERDLTNTVYVTSNPVLYRRDDIDTHFHDIWNIWMEDGWDDEHGTVLPETMTRYAKKAADEYPNKRLIIHYIQPHYPFIGSGTNFDKNHLPDPDQPHFWFRLMSGELTVSRDEIWKAYNNNLELVLPYAEELINKLDGKSVITSDHGNMVGEKSTPIPIIEWGHPPSLYTEQLVKVPWLEPEWDNRKEIVAEQPNQSSSTASESEVVQRLNDLGYVAD